MAEKTRDESAVDLALNRKNEGVRELPQTGPEMLRALLDAMARFDRATGQMTSGMYAQGTNELALRNAVEMLWGSQVLRDLEPMPEAESTRKADQAEVRIEDPPIAMMSLAKQAAADTAAIVAADRRARDQQAAGAKLVANWALGRK